MNDNRVKEQPIDLNGQAIEEVFNAWQVIANLADQQNQTQKANHQKDLLNLTQKILREKLSALTHAHLKTLFDQLQKEVDVENELLREAVDFELLKAMQKKILALNINGDEITAKLQTEKKSFKKYAPYVLVLIACVGIFKGISDGFNGVNALLALVGLSGTPIAFVVYAVFILTGVAVYIAFDYNRIARVLGVTLLAARGAIKKVYEECELLNAICTEMKQIIQNATINSFISDQNHQNLVPDLQAYKSIITLRIQVLRNKHKMLSFSRPSEFVRVVGKGIVAILGGSLFFSSGFFAGYSLSVGLFAMAVGSFPAILIGFVVASACLISYIFLENSGFFKIIDLLGGTSEKLDKQIENTLSELTSLELNLTKNMKLLMDASAKKKVSDIPVGLQDASLNSRPVFVLPCEQAGSVSEKKEAPSDVPSSRV